MNLLIIRFNSYVNIAVTVGYTCLALLFVKHKFVLDVVTNPIEPDANKMIILATIILVTELVFDFFIKAVARRRAGFEATLTSRRRRGKM